MYDTIIVGAGPAGFTAAIYAVRREMKTLIIGSEIGGQIIWAHEIENYPGFENINNFELINRFQEHAIKAGSEFKNSEVKRIEKNSDNFFTLYTNKDSYRAKTVILAMGLSPRRLEIPGEQNLNGKGVSYCANCDGPLYRDKVVAVIGGGNSAFDAAEVMSKIAKQVYLINRNDKFKAFDSLVKDVYDRPNIEIITWAEMKSINGQDKVDSLTYYHQIDKQEKTLNLDGVFVEVGRIAHTDLVADIVDRDQSGQILTDHNYMTKTPGLFAAGDVVSSDFKQITIANGQATVAALAAYQYLQKEFSVNK